MHLTPELFLMEDSEKTYGPLAHLFVHESPGHLRWGLFDEYKMFLSMAINYLNPYFYLDMDTKQYEPVVCTKNIKGRALMNCNPTKPCDLSNFKYPLPYECRYCPVGDQITPVSLMGHSYITSVENFCKIRQRYCKGLQTHNNYSKCPEHTLQIQKYMGIQKRT